MENKNISKKYFISNDNKFALIDIVDDTNKEHSILVPLVFEEYNFDNIDEMFSKLTKDFTNFKERTRDINLIFKSFFKYLNNYINSSGDLINIDYNNLKSYHIDDDDDDDDDDADVTIDELLRVFVKTLKINSMEVCSNCGDYLLLYKKKIYNYDKDKMKLNLSNIENLKETKHLYGCRLFDFKTQDFYDNIEIKKFTSITLCSDSDEDMNNLNDTETENKISALKKLCGILKNMNESDSPKEKSRNNEEFNYDSSSFLKSNSSYKSKNNTKTKTKTTKNRDNTDSNESEDINVQSLREKIKKLNSDKKKNKSYSGLDSDNESNHSHQNNNEEENKEEPSQFQQLILYFLTNPDSLPKLIDSVNNTIDSFTDNLNPTKLLGRNRPLRIQKYFSNVNLVLKYIEMLKIIELKYKQTLEFRCNCDDFELEDEAIYFNEHLNKIWEMVKLIICELSALRLNNITCTTPQCEDIKFNSSDLFLKDNRKYKKILQKIGFATLANGDLDSTKIYLDPTCSKILLINTITQHQRIIVKAFRKYMQTPYENLNSNMNTATSESDVNKAVWEKMFNALDKGITFAEVQAATDYDTSSFPGGAANKYAPEGAADANKHAAMQALDTAFTAVSDFDATKFIDSFVEVVTKTFDFTNTKLKATSTNGGGNTANHYALGVNYGTDFDEAPSSLKTDRLIGSLYVLEQSNLSSTMKTLVEKTIKKLLVKGKAAPNNFTGHNVVLNDIRGLTSKCELSEEYLPSDINVLQYVDNGLLKTIDIDSNSDNKVSSAEYIAALNLIYDSTKSKYNEILKISYTTQINFRTDLSDKANKDVIIQRRKKLINFLKQLENDTNLSLSFFGEMASSYNTTTDSKVLNAPPDVFLNIFKNHKHEHQNNQNHYHPHPNNNHHSNAYPHHHNHRGTSGEPSPQPKAQAQAQEPASARTAGSNDILNDSDDNYDETTDEESETGFKLRESPKENTNSFRKTYTGSKKNYN